MEKPIILQSYMMRSKSNEGYAAKLYYSVYKDGTIVIIKRVVTKISPLNDDWKLIKRYSNYSVVQTVFSIRTQSLMELGGTVAKLIPQMELKPIL